jgi:hypothetical protein
VRLRKGAGRLTTDDLVEDTERRDDVEEDGVDESGNGRRVERLRLKLLVDVVEEIDVEERRDN